MNKSEFHLKNIRWVDLIKPQESDLVQLSEELSIPNRILVNALDPEHLPKYEQIDSSTVIYLRVIDSSKTQAVNIQDLTTKITLIIKDNTLVSIHRLDHPFLVDLRAKCVQKNYTLKDLIKHIITCSLETYELPLISLEERVEVFEEKIFQNSRSQFIVKEGYFLKRRASSFRKCLKFSLDILHSLQTRPDFIWRDFQGLRESIERNLFYIEDVLENITGLLNLHISLSSQKTNEVMRILTVFSIFFLPLNFLTGVYGMNFEHMPELHFRYGYFCALLAMFITASTTFYWVYKRGWLERPR